MLESITLIREQKLQALKNLGVDVSKWERLGLLLKPVANLSVSSDPS